MTGTGPDAGPHSSPDGPTPRTPPGSTKAEYCHPWSPRSGAASPKSSPPDSPSLSLHSLGMSPFSPLLRHLSSPFVRSSSPLHPPDPDPDSDSDSEPSDQEDIVQDSRDVLVQRLNDLAAQLSRKERLKEESINSLHARVDEMETALSLTDRPAKRAPPRSKPAGLALQTPKSEGDPSWVPLTPGRIIPSIPSISLSAQNSPPRRAFGESTDTPGARAANEVGMSPEQARRVVAEVQNLCKELEAVSANLRARQEESDHIHELLVTRAERAAQKIIHLERRIKELESERNEGEMEMLNLQIQLKAIEVQCLSYVPENADEDLRESISTWKTEWATLKRRRARRKAGGGEDARTPGTPTRHPRDMAAAS
ncbi:hypothetical protein GGS23DRAFT_97663 [Durotheca rogersii]|uniref:uncharacterized protein n=1 Tax=Durotheca rogersii TaxID=419775 RepID=UPI00221ED8CA|nr:uncharacterized protein GGS23DRAFT_97663 [Durotheca rogersii]KAI5862378.1 hypothetical protein GGS23DRAFT_97663 [Durotheca rogersii]